MDKLNLRNFNHLDEYISSRLGDFYTVSNTYIREWARYIKYSLTHKLLDSDLNLYITIKDMHSVSVVYTSDKKITFEKVLNFLLKWDYLLKCEDVYYFNNKLFSETLFLRDGIKYEFDYENNFNNTLCHQNPWCITESPKEYILYGFSDIMNTLVPICFYEKKNTSHDLIVLDSLKEKLECPLYLQLIDKCSIYFKKHSDFIHSKRIKDLYAIFEEFNPTKHIFYNLIELEEFLKDNDDHNIIEFNPMHSSTRFFDLFENKSRVATFVATGPTTYETIATLLLVVNIDNIKSLLKDFLQFIEDEELIKNINALLKQES